MILVIIFIVSGFSTQDSLDITFISKVVLDQELGWPFCWRFMLLSVQASAAKG